MSQWNHSELPKHPGPCASLVELLPEQWGRLQFNLCTQQQLALYENMDEEKKKCLPGFVHLHMRLWILAHWTGGEKWSQWLLPFARFCVRSWWGAAMSLSLSLSFLFLIILWTFAGHNAYDYKLLSEKVCTHSHMSNLWLQNVRIGYTKILVADLALSHWIYSIG